MVIERFKQGCAGAVGERFRRQGRMLPDGVVYRASWIEPSGSRCFQVMEADSADLLGVWTARWDELVDLEMVQVLPSAEFWGNQQPGQS